MVAEPEALLKLNWSKAWQGCPQLVLPPEYFCFDCWEAVSFLLAT